MNRNIIKLLFIGNILEYYDFSIYGVFSIVMAPAFFPAFDSFSQILLSLVIFISGFIARPLGGIIFGYLGDKYGRKLAITTSIAGMALATCSIGLLPLYEQIGILAPILLFMLRIIQGVCLGGEGTGMTIFILEHLYKYKQGFINGLVSASGITGTLIATLIGLCLTRMPIAAELSWRLAFILGGLLGVLSLIMRNRLMETPIYSESIKHKRTDSIPIVQLIITQPYKVLTSIMLAGLLGAMCYLMMMYNNLLFNKILGIGYSKSLGLSSCGILCLIIFMPLVGKFCDKYGHQKIIIISCLSTILLIKPLFNMLLIVNYASLIGSLFILAALTAGVAAPAYQYMFNMFMPLQRYSGMAFGFNVGMALLGSTMPLISMYLIKLTGSNTAPAFYIIFMATTTLIIVGGKQSYDKFLLLVTSASFILKYFGSTHK